MRIIAGQFRGRILLPPPTDATRPITDRAKQSLFDILTPLLPGARVYDCFAGTGSMGLESLSRGATHATFFESDRGALAALRKNIATLKLESQSTLIPGDIFKHFSSPQSQISNLESEIIFLDPPYRFLRQRPADIQQLAQSLARNLHPTGLIVFRHDSADLLSLPGLHVADLRTYGSMTIEFLSARTS